MFSYFGAKQKLVKLYPEPHYPLVIEPFAGSAAYSLLHKPQQVWINDFNPRVKAAWDWIRQATPEQVAAIPEPKMGDYLTNYRLPPGLRVLMAMAVNRGKADACYKITSWCKPTDIRRLKERLLAECPLIRHWKVTKEDYKDIPNQEATWFVDPPYQKSGHNYSFSLPKGEYKKLAEWCKSRKGQVIVCEEEGDRWLPFKRLAEITAGVSKRRYTEMFWTNL
jgi:site-specific DNA-adenine methylase